MKRFTKIVCVALVATILFGMVPMAHVRAQSPTVNIGGQVYYLANHLGPDAEGWYGSSFCGKGQIVRVHQGTCQPWYPNGQAPAPVQVQPAPAPQTQPQPQVEPQQAATTAATPAAAPCGFFARLFGLCNDQPQQPASEQPAPAPQQPQPAPSPTPIRTATPEPGIRIEYYKEFETDPNIGFVFLATCATTATGTWPLALVDGPLPFGDAVLGVIVIGTAAYAVLTYDPGEAMLVHKGQMLTFAKAKAQEKVKAQEKSGQASAADPCPPIPPVNTDMSNPGNGYHGGSGHSLEEILEAMKLITEGASVYYSTAGGQVHACYWSSKAGSLGRHGFQVFVWQGDWRLKTTFMSSAKFPDGPFTQQYQRNPPKGFCK